MAKIGPGSFRLFLAFVVVLHHSTPLRLGTWAVGLFFCLSGFWIAEMWVNKYSLLDRPYPKFLLSRWWRLAPVLFAVSLIAIGVMRSGFLADDINVLHKPSWWWTQPLIAGSTVMGRLLPPVWSLDVEMQFYIIAPIITILLVRLPLSTQLAALFLALAWGWLRESRGIAGETARIDIWLGVFLLGMIASTNRWQPTPKAALGTTIGVIAVFAIIATLPSTRPWIILRGSVGHPITGYLYATLTVGTIVLSAPLAIWTTRRPSIYLDRFFGDLSYPLYLFHWLPRDWYYAHAHNITHRSDLVALLGINLSASLLGAVAVLLIVDRPLQHIRTGWVKRKSNIKLNVRRLATSADVVLA